MSVLRLNPAPSPFGASTSAGSRDPKSIVFFSKFSSSSLLVCSTSTTAGAKWEISVQKAWNSKVEDSPENLDDSPASVQLTPVSGEIQFDRVLDDAQRLQESVVFVWMASWCRKCIYLKPKLEKLAAEYHPRLRFYCVDVNTVPHRLVTRAGVTKMPTIQLWKDKKKQVEVIGGQKAHFVISEVQKMIENESTLL